MSDKPEFSVLLYYQFAPIADPEGFVQNHLNFCNEHGIKGRILVSEKGINGTCSGLKSDIEKYKSFVHSLPGFEKTWFKEHSVDRIPFRAIYVRTRDEIVAFGKDVDVKQGAPHVSPAQLNEWIENDEVLLFDMRNDIEYEVGHFKGAYNPNTLRFKEIPDLMENFEKFKDKKVVMYCTGGIRCEVASPHFRALGFKEVYQLEGGIYNYCEQFPNGYFDGDCFVFDERMAIRFTEDGVKTSTDIDQSQAISKCNFCKVSSNRIVNDESKDGRELVICCKKCDDKLDISRVRKKGEGYRA